MQSVEIWSQLIPQPADPLSTLTNQVWSCAINPDGSVLVCVVGDAVLLYNALNGELLNKPLRNAHNQQINCAVFSKDGKRFCTVSRDRSVIVWNYNANENPRVQPELQYSHAEQVYTASFNPLTSQIFTGGEIDMALWTPDVSNIDKLKFKQKILSSAWSADGQTVAFGTVKGTISMRTRKLEEQIEISGAYEVWCMEWSPITNDYQESILLVGAWNQTITMYNSSGQQLGVEKKMKFDPLCLNFFSNSEFYVLSGTNKKASLYTRDGGFLVDICQMESWIWSSKIKGKQLVVALTTNEGHISVHEVKTINVYAFYSDQYVFREHLTDVIIQNVSTNQKIRVKCQELVQSVSIYKDKLAALLNDKIMVYIASQQNDIIKYGLLKKINKQLPGNKIFVLNSHIVSFFNRKVQLFQISGELEREWVFESNVNYLRTLGGPSKKEGILLALENGLVAKLFINNPFPVTILKHQVSITKIDLSADKKKLAIVDEKKNLTVFQLSTKQQIFQEMNITSVAFQEDFDDMIAYSGNGMLFIQTSNQPPLTQKINGNVLGFKGSKLFILFQSNLQTVDVSFTLPMMKYIEKQDWQNAYAVASLGYSSADFRALGMESLYYAEMDIAQKCFLRIKDIGYIDLTERWRYQKRKGTLKEVFLQADVLAFQGKFKEAADLLSKNNFQDKAIELYAELKQFQMIDQIAPSRPATGAAGLTIIDRGRSGQQMTKLYREEADWKMKTGDWKGAGQLYQKCNLPSDYKKAIQIYMNNNYLQGIIDVSRQLDPSENAANIHLCCSYFKKVKEHRYAKETFLKLNNLPGLMMLHIQFEKFEEALLLAKQSPDLMQIVQLPYADFLCKQDKHQEALKVYKSMNRFDLTSKILQNLIQNATVENRFSEASVYLWNLAAENLEQVSNARQPANIDDIEHLEFFYLLNDQCEVYKAYERIVQFIQAPFQQLSSETYMSNILNAARFAISQLQNNTLPGIKQSYLYYALGKVAQNLEIYQTARMCYEKLSQYKIPPEWTQQVELNNLLIRSKPFSDNEKLMPVCYRCMHPSPILNLGNTCTTCKHEFVFSSNSYEPLSLVEFQLQTNITHRQFLEFINSEKPQINKNLKKQREPQDDGWTESTVGNEQVLTFTNQNGMSGEIDSLFIDKLNEIFQTQQTSQDYIPVVLDQKILRSLEAEEVYWIDYSNICPTMDFKYYQCMVPEIPLKVCEFCKRFSLLDEFQFQFMQTKRCSFCQTLDKRIVEENDEFSM